MRVASDEPDDARRKRALAELPKQGSRAPWKLRQNYVLDRIDLRRADVDDGVMQFR